MAASDATPETVKVFVGNLSFKITQDQLKDAFKSVGGVVSANIITRGPRSLGYGFVEFSSHADAEKAVVSLNQTDLDNRPINVEIAKPRVPRTETTAQGENAPKPAAAAATGAAAAAGTTAAAGARRRTPRRPRQRRPRAAAAAGTAATGEAAAATPAAASSSASPAATSSAPRQPRAPRAPRAPRNNDNKEASKTTLFIANLPFRIDEAGLAQLFIDQACPPKSTRVVQRRERSKGFGFAEFEDEQKQQAALAALDKAQVDGRVLIVKVAFALADAAPAAPTEPAASS